MAGKKLTKKEFFEILREAGEIGDDFEAILNSIACYCWFKYHTYENEGKTNYAKIYKDEAKTIHNALEKRGYYDK